MSSISQIWSFLEKFGVRMDDPQVYKAYDGILNGLQEMGLSSKEARILLYLVTRKQATAVDISKHNDIGRTETYNHITSLMSWGLVFSNFGRPQKYYALPLDKAIDHLVETRREALQHLLAAKEEYCKMIEKASSSMSLSNVEEKNSYQILSGKNALSSTIKRITLGAKEEIILLLNEKTFVDLYHAGIMDDVASMAKRGIAVRLQTSYKNTQEYAGGTRQAVGNNKIVIESIEEKMVNFVLVDNKEIVVMLLDGKPEKSKLHGFYTNNLPIISVFKAFFEKSG